MKFIILIISSITFATISRAASANPDTTLYLNAKQLAQSARWSAAQAAGRKLVRQQSSDPRAWYLLGVVEERMAKYGPATRAFAKVAKLQPNGPLGKASASKLAILAPKARRQLQYKYGPASWGLFVGVNPLTQNQLTSELGSSLSSTFDLGFSVNNVSFGYLLGTGSVSEIQAAPEGSASGGVGAPAQVYSVVHGPGIHTMQELFFTLPFVLVKPYERWGRLQLKIPLQIGGVENTLAIGGKTFGSLGFDFDSGLQADYFTRSPFVISLEATYHLGMPFWGIRQDGNSPAIKGSGGELVTAGVSGFQIGLSVTFLFGASQPNLVPL